MSVQGRERERERTRRNRSTEREILEKDSRANTMPVVLAPRVESGRAPARAGAAASGDETARGYHPCRIGFGLGQATALENGAQSAFYFSVPILPGEKAPRPRALWRRLRIIRRRRPTRAEWALSVAAARTKKTGMLKANKQMGGTAAETHNGGGKRHRAGGQ